MTAGELAIVDIIAAGPKHGNDAATAAVDRQNSVTVAVRDEDLRFA
jgi:hypothetical protein